MSRYNRYFENHFSGCVFLAAAFDPYRDRKVELRAIPGQFDIVGVTDGTDCWIAPVIANPFSVNVAKLMQNLREGKLTSASKPRHQLVEAKPRRRLVDEEEIKPRRRNHVSA